jgi:glyoxylase-like metal-dependent hydrolase (beta-lactamase superfamily II)
VNITTLVVGAYAANCHLIEGAAAALLVVDPGADAERLLARLKGRRIAAYLLTHGHVDHLSAVRQLAATLPAPVAMHPADARWAFTPLNQLTLDYPVPQKPPGTLRALADGQVWEEAGLRYRILETPGHTPGSVCFYFEDERALFTGDTLFAGSVGRTDLPGGDEDLLAQSLERLAALPVDTALYPGHGPASTIGAERAGNIFLSGR